jgi:hypothetical protein
MTAFRTALLLAALALLALFINTGVKAADVNEEGAQAVKAMFQKMLDYQKTLSNVDEAGQMVYEGELTVEPVGTYYAVTFPHMKLSYRTGEILDIGMISANVSPHKTAGQWAMTMAVPTPLVFLNNTGTQDFKISIGSQSTAGIWDEKTLTFQKLDASYKDIKLESSTEEPFHFNIPEIAVRYDFNIDAAGLWSGPGYVTIKNLTAKLPENAGSAAVREFRLDVSMDRYNPNSSNDLRDKVMALNEKIEAQQSQDGAEAVNTSEAAKEELEKLSADVLQTMLKSANGFKGNYKLSGLSISRPSILGQGEDSVQIEDVNFGFDLTGLLEENVKLGFDLGFLGFAMAPHPPGVPQEFLPKDMKFNILFENLPLQKILEMATTQPTPADGNGISITLNENFISNDTFRVNLDGKYKIDTTSPLMAVGNGKLVIHGLDETITRVTNMAAETPGDPNIMQMQQAVMGLNMVKAFAKPEAAADGKISYVLEIELTPQGQYKVNGQDMGATFGGGAPAQPAPAPQDPSQPEDMTAPAE